jgi:hypothetical protein
MESVVSPMKYSAGKRPRGAVRAAAMEMADEDQCIDDFS